MILDDFVAQRGRVAKGHDESTANYRSSLEPWQLRVLSEMVTGKIGSDKKMFVSQTAGLAGVVFIIQAAKVQH